MAIDFFADLASPSMPIRPTPPSSEPSALPKIDFFANEPSALTKSESTESTASSMVEATNRYEQKANEATDPKLKDALNATADAAAETLEKKPEPIDFFAGTAPTVTEQPAGLLRKTAGVARQVLATPGDVVRGMGGAVTDLIKGVGTAVGTLGSMATALGPPGGGETNVPQQQGTAAWQALGKGAETYAEDLATKPGTTLRGTAGTLIGGPALGEFARTGKTKDIKKDPYGTLLNVLLAAPTLKPFTLGITATALTNSRRLIEAIPGGASVLRPIDALAKQILPKHKFTDEFMGLEQSTAGTTFYKNLTEAKPQALIAGELIASNPKAAAFMTPELTMSTPNLKALNKGYDTFMNKQVTTGPYGVPLSAAQISTKDFAFNKGNLNVMVDRDGFMRYAKADEFNALTAEEQRNVFNARKIIDTNHEALYKAGYLTEEQFTAGAWSYAHDSYRVFHNEADWLHQVRNNPITKPIWATAHAKVAKTLKNPLDQTKKATLEQVDNELWAILRQTRELLTSPDIATVRSPADSAISVLIKRKNIPPEIKDLLGRMDGAFFPVRIGETIAMQNTQLITDAMFTRMATMRGADGRLLVIQKTDKPLKPVSIPPPTGATFWSGVDERAAMRRHVGPADLDYTALNAEGGRYNPVWGPKWADAQVHPDVIDAIHTINAPQMGGILAKYMQLWKASKVADNLPTHINNMAGDIHVSILGGGSFANPRNWGEYKSAFSDVVDFMKLGTISPRLAREMQMGIMRPGMASVEMGADYAQILHPGSARTAEQWLEKYMQSRAQSGLSKTYDMEDQMFRVGLGRVLQRQGMSLQQAGIEVAKYFPSYDVSSPVGNFLRGHANLGPLSASLGAFIGGPFTSFPMESMRIAMTAAKEHPMRLVAANMFPLTVATIGMGASGLTLEDYHDLLKNQPPHQQGKLLMPVPLPSGKVGFVDWTNFIPGADMNVRKEAFGISNRIGPVTVPMPQGMIFTGPAWSILDAIQNRSPRTGKPLVDPTKGESASNWINHLVNSILPIPTSLIDASRRAKHAVQGTQSGKYEQEPQGFGSIPTQSFTPQFGNIKSLEDLQKEASVVKRGRLGAIKGGMKNVRKDKTLTDQEKDAQRERARDSRQDIKEGFK